MYHSYKKFVAAALVALLISVTMMVNIPATAEASEIAGGHIIETVSAAGVNQSRLNVRALPSTSDPILTTLPAGTTINICGVSDNGWFQVVCGTSIGYVFANLVTLVPVDPNTQAALAQQAAAVKQTAAAQAAAHASAAAAAAATPAIAPATVMPAVPAAAPVVPAPVVPAPAVPAAGVPAQATAPAFDPSLLIRPTVPAISGVPGVIEGSGNVIFVGDSRTGQMGNAVGGTAAYPNCAFVAAYGGGYSWLCTDRAKQEIDQFIIPGSIIIVNYGVNDFNSGRYIELLNRYSRDWNAKGAAVYFASVGQVGDNPFEKTNKQITWFNDDMFNRLAGNIGRIDLYGYFAAYGYQTVWDGMHYTPDTYARMFTFLMSQVGRM